MAASSPEQFLKPFAGDNQAVERHWGNLGYGPAYHIRSNPREGQESFNEVPVTAMLRNETQVTSIVWDASSTVSGAPKLLNGVVGPFNRVAPQMGICPPEDKLELRAIQQHKFVKRLHKSNKDGRRGTPRSYGLFKRAPSQMKAYVDEAVEVEDEERSPTVSESTSYSTTQRSCRSIRSHGRSNSFVASFDGVDEEDDEEEDDEDYEEDDEEDDDEDYEEDDEEDEAETSEDEEKREEENEGEQNQDEEDEEPVRKRPCRRRRLVPYSDLHEISFNLRANDLGPTPTPLCVAKQVWGERGINSMIYRPNGIAAYQQPPVPASKERYYKDEILRLHNLLATSQLQMDALQQDGENTARCLAITESHLRIKVEENTALRGEVSTLGEELQSLYQEGEELQARLAQAGPEEESWEGESWEEEVAEAYQRVEEAEEELKELQLSFKVGQIDNALLEQSLATAKAAKAELQSRYVSIREACSDVIQYWGSMAGDSMGPAAGALQNLKTQMQSE